MLHCTKFDFICTSEEAIVKAFRKLDINCSTELVSEFKSEFSKQVLGRLGFVVTIFPTPPTTPETLVNIEVCE